MARVWTALTLTHATVYPASLVCTPRYCTARVRMRTYAHFYLRQVSGVNCRDTVVFGRVFLSVCLSVCAQLIGQSDQFGR